MWKYPPSQVLVPIDFGDASRRAVEVAAALAHRYDAKLLLLHAETFEAPAYFTHEQVAVIERERMVARGVARRHLTTFVDLAAVPYSVQVVQAPPADAILDASNSSDLIVMGTHGRKGPGRWWLGSVAERVSRDASVPVMVVRAVPVGTPVDTVFSRPMLVSTRDSLGGAAARYASGLAESSNGNVSATVARCQADVARQRDATMMVVARPNSTGGWFGESVEGMLRSCALPMLFVPGEQ